MIEREHFFVHIQKTGGDSIAAALGEDPNRPYKHFTALQLRSVISQRRWNAAFTFSIVRNPWDRLVSWWSMIDGHRDAYLRGKALNRFQTFVLSRATSFDEFLLSCDAEIPDIDGDKWIYRNQIDYLVDEDGARIVDFIGRHERLIADFDEIASRLGKTGLHLPHVNRSAHRPYADYYSADMVELVRQRYARDIEAFGYTFGA